MLEELSECYICTTTFRLGEQVTAFANCLHWLDAERICGVATTTTEDEIRTNNRYFNRGLENWFEVVAKCPLCREDVLPMHIAH